MKCDSVSTLNGFVEEKPLVDKKSLPYKTEKNCFEVWDIFFSILEEKNIMRSKQKMAGAEKGLHQTFRITVTRNTEHWIGCVGLSSFLDEVRKCFGSL